MVIFSQLPMSLPLLHPRLIESMIYSPPKSPKDKYYKRPFTFNQLSKSSYRPPLSLLLPFFDQKFDLIHQEPTAVIWRHKNSSEEVTSQHRLCDSPFARLLLDGFFRLAVLACPQGRPSMHTQEGGSEGVDTLDRGISF
jgi:hypothetical protein